MKAAIETLSELVKDGRKIAVMGDMLELGSVEEEAHRQVGRELGEHKFAAVVTRGKLGALIAEGAKESGIEETFSCGSHEEAAAKLKEILQPGDTVLFKGSRGMAMEKIIDLLK
jgi:UDP-N-acetylmuramoyl-tripeptide--D-alanyl-D-alanine ligase/murE/murF fusion protein